MSNIHRWYLLLRVAWQGGCGRVLFCILFCTDCTVWRLVRDVCLGGSVGVAVTGCRGVGRRLGAVLRCVIWDFVARAGAVRGLGCGPVPEARAEAFRALFFSSLRSQSSPAHRLSAIFFCAVCGVSIFVCADADNVWVCGVCCMYGCGFGPLPLALWGSGSRHGSLALAWRGFVRMAYSFVCAHNTLFVSAALGNIAYCQAVLYDSEIVNMNPNSTKACTREGPSIAGPRQRGKGALPFCCDRCTPAFAHLVCTALPGTISIAPSEPTNGLASFCRERRRAPCGSRASRWVG